MLSRRCAAGFAYTFAVLHLLLSGCSDSGTMAAKAQPLKPDAAFDAVLDAASSSADIVLVCPGAPGCPCTENGDCDLGICADDPYVEGGKACARSCVDVCPGGYKCANVSVGGSDVYSICVPRWGRVCDPCTTSTDCDSLGISGLSCIDQGDQGMYCGSACAADGDCPNGYGCKQVTTAEGGKATQCIRLPSAGGDGFGQCPCSTRAVKLKLSTSCAVPVTGPDGKLAGSCKGNRGCSTKGLSECVAAPPLAEACNGLDDNCNGLTDEGSCDDKNACTLDICDGKSTCSHKLLDGTACDDGSACTDGDQCQQGACVPGKTKNCDDKNICTKDQCDAVKGCAHAPDEGAPCDDDNACTLGDVCAQGQCQAGVPKICKSPDGCTTATCSLSDGKCNYVKVAEGTPCEDGVVCTDKDTCKLGVCGGVPMSCDDGNVCTTDACDAKKGCIATPQGQVTCDDGNPCTLNDKCQSGQCLGAQLVCDDKNACTADACNAQGTCTFLSKSGACDDGDPCTVGDQCAGFACKPGNMVCACKQDSDCPDDKNVCNGSLYCDTSSVPYGCKVKPATVPHCDDDNVCTTDSCDPTSGCQHVNNATACSDGNGCTVGDACSGGKCSPGANTCQCTVTPDCLALEDGNVCNGTLMCDTKTLPYKCVVDPATIVTCTPPVGTCAVGTCAPTTGTCSYVPQNNGQSCNADNNACTVGDACSGGKCIAGSVANCDDGNACTSDSCSSATGCAHAPLAVACTDGNPCTLGDICSQGVCTPGSLKDCNDGNACTIDSCNVATSACVNKASSATCDDGNACTANDTCAAGQCSGSAINPATACSDSNACTQDGCDTVKGCTHTLNCDDGNDCTVDSCASPSSGCQHPAAPLGQACGSGGICDGKGKCTPVPTGMVFIPGGTFWMGCNFALDPGCPASATPQHKVTLSSYFMDKTEVTVGQYKACVSDGACAAPYGGCTDGAPWWPDQLNNPVPCATWEQARTYCKWHGVAAGYDLPTEAQWEMAARGSCEKNGSSASNAACKSAMRTFPWGEELATCTYAVMPKNGQFGCGTSATFAVGAKPAGDSPYGLHDMAGNAQEWTRDGSQGYSAADQTDPYVPLPSALQSYAVTRGGAFDGGWVATTDRGGESAYYYKADLGFRCSKTFP